MSTANQERALVFQIIHGSFVDGYGVRTTIFLKGCPLRCVWCCNPEGQQGHPELKYIASHCNACGNCLPVCPTKAISLQGANGAVRARIDRDRCDNCGKCVDVCYTGALDCFGTYYTVDQLFDEAKKDERFYSASGGGVTIGGGEPTLQPTFLRRFLKKCKDRYIHTAIDTCLYTMTEEGLKALEEADLLLCDIKGIDPEEHRMNTGVRNDVMARVMTFLLGAGGGVCQPEVLTGFEGYPNGDMVMFRQPGFSTLTRPHLASQPNLASVTDEVAAFDGTKSYKLQWKWLDASTSRWLQLETTDAPSLPNPTIDLTRAVRLRIRLDAGQFRLCLGVRETGTTAPIGTDGGTTGTIEWVGATSVASGVPQGVLVDAQPGVWQTITFPLSASNVLPFTGDGVLYSATRKGVLDCLAFASTGNAGPFTVYIDGLDQPCPPVADFDGDGDVDQDDFAHIQACLSGTSVAQTDPACLNARLDGDADVDEVDLGRFLNCFSGADNPVDPACGN